MPFDIEPIRQQIQHYQQQGLRLFATSSFQSYSIPMLHIISRIDASIPIYFLHTGYHFPETLTYKEQITALLGLNVIDLKPAIPKHLQRDTHGQLYFTSDPDLCCHINKVQPLEPVLAEKDVWITGVRRDQSTNREEMSHEEQAPQSTLRYHPMLDFDKRMIVQYLKAYELPRHPLELKGYVSIGCEPCTKRVDIDQVGSERDGRWSGLNKTECGLHTELMNNKANQ